MSFRKDFLWGAATAAYQIEGAAFEDGRGASVWDEFCRKPDNIFDNHNGDVACDHYHLYKKDVSIMKEIGLRGYRFSISWPRVLPDGTGKINEKGLDFYKRLLDELNSTGIIPYATLYHWDLPYSLYKKGGWLNDDSPKWFEEYAHLIAERLGNKLKNYITFNEPQCFIGIGYAQETEPRHAPGLEVSRKDAMAMAHNVLLAHGRAVRAIRSDCSGAVIGYAPTASACYPIDEAPENIEAARKALFSVTPENWCGSVSWWSDPVFFGRYPECAGDMFKDDMPVVGNDDMKIISEPLDFYCQNIYNGPPVRAKEGGGFELALPREAGFPRASNKWPITPKSMYYVPKFLCERYKMPLYITENGMSAHDVVSLDGKVHDPNRIDFLHRYLRELKHAAKDGADVRGYFEWSLLDNFEWGEGYNERFGLVHVDFQTQERILKDSAFWYKSIIESNGETL